MHLCDTYINTAVSVHLDPFLVVRAHSSVWENGPPKKRQAIRPKAISGLDELCWFIFHQSGFWTLWYTKQEGNGFLDPYLHPHPLGLWANQFSPMGGRNSWDPLFRILISQEHLGTGFFFFFHAQSLPCNSSNLIEPGNNNEKHMSRIKIWSDSRCIGKSKPLSFPFTSVWFLCESVPTWGTGISSICLL